MSCARTDCAKGLKPLRRLLVVLLAGVMATTLRSETPCTAKQYLVDVWRSDRGLPQNTVTGIAQTTDGYLWVSTLDGLARFDGERFKIFNAGNTPVLGSGRIRFLFRGQGGVLWICIQEGEVIKFHDGRFTSLPLPESKDIRPATIQVAEDKAGGLWLSTEDGRVQRLVNGRWDEVSTNWGRASGTGYQVRADQKGRLWAITDAGLYEVAGDRVVPVLQGKTGEYVVLCSDRSGGWWIRSGDKIRLWRDGQWRVTMPGPFATSPPLELRSSLEDRHGRLWLGTWGHGLLGCETNGNMLSFTKQEGLGADFVRVLCEDDEGNLWAGLHGGGLCRVRAPLFSTYGLVPGLSWEWITSVSEGANGELWVGTDGYGLNRLQGEVIQPGLPEAANPPMYIISAISDCQGQVWLATRAAGLFRWKDGRITPLKGTGIVNLLPRSLYEDSGGAIWVGWRNTDRLGRIQSGILSDVELPKWLGLVDVRVMTEDASGSLWIGTDGNGLLRWKEGQFTRLTRENGLGSDFIWALHPERDGTLWVGTYGGGLTRWKNGQAVTCTTLQGLVDDVICYMADDGRGQYWFSSHQGIFRVSKRDLNLFADGVSRTVKCVAYGKSDGLPTLECKGGYQPAGCRTRDGRLWFSTIAGLVVIDPASVSTNLAAPVVYVEEIVVDGHATELEARQRVGSKVSVPQSGRVVHGSTAIQMREYEPPSSSLSIAAGCRRLEFHYTGLSFSAAERLRFRHKLEGVDAEWVETGDQREASYNNLRHGAYTFHVQACGREGGWGQGSDAVAFNVLPFFWQTWWFIGLFLVTFGGAIAWTVGLALRRRHQRHLKLVSQLHAAERARAQIARDIHDDLGSSLTEIGLLGALAVRETTPRAEARQQAGRMMMRAEELARKLDETVWAVNPKNDTLKHLSSYLCNLTKEFLEPASIHCRLDVAADLPDLPLPAEARHNLFLAAKEAVHNAVKHSGATELWLRMRVEGGAFILEIEDNGRGLAEGEPREGGNGLRNMAGRMQEIGGEFGLHTAPAKGTTVRLQFPLSRTERDGAGPGPRQT
jgi:signal transduction histidine kinase/ligand-binding sensor domain-containing protein